MYIYIYIYIHTPNYYLYTAIVNNATFQLKFVKLFSTASVHNQSSTQACASSLLFFTAFIIAITLNATHTAAPRKDRACVSCT